MTDSNPKTPRRRRKSTARTRKPLVNSGKPCKDGPHKTNRATPYPGPRCKTCHLAVSRARRSAAKQAYVAKTYSIDEDFYQAMYREQGGASAICQWAKGTGAKRLSVDHDHACCNGPVSCGGCVRGLLDKSCNRDILGHLRDDPVAFARGIRYLVDPPANRVRRGNGPLVLNVTADQAYALLEELEPLIDMLRHAPTK